MNHHDQVHGARLRGSQEDVVIKVLKPGIEDFLVADLNFIYVVARIFEFLSPEFSRTSLVNSQIAVDNPNSSVFNF